MKPITLASSAARVAVLTAGIAVLLVIPWDTPVRAGRVGCLTVGIRTWLVGFALVLAALQWFAVGSNSGKSARGL